MSGENFADNERASYFLQENDLCFGDVTLADCAM